MPTPYLTLAGITIAPHLSRSAWQIERNQIWRWIMKKKYILFLVGLALFIALLSYGCSNPFTPAGHEGFVGEIRLLISI